MYVVKKLKNNVCESKTYFKKKAQAKSFIRKNSGGINMGFIFLIEETANGAEIKKKRNFVKTICAK